MLSELMALVADVVRTFFAEDLVVRFVILAAVGGIGAVIVWAAGRRP